MQKFTTAILSLVFCSAMVAQSQAQQVQTPQGKVHCSYFMTFGWGCSYPGMFTAQFNPTDSTLTVTPVPGAFGGITSVAVFDDLTCGTLPLCSHQLPKPVKSGTVPLPGPWWESALEAQPLFIRICWKELPVK